MLEGFKEYEILTEAINEGIKLNNNGEYEIIILFSVEKRVFYVLYSKDFDKVREDLDLKKFIIKQIIEGKEKEEEKLKEEDVFSEGKKIQEGDDRYISVDDFRNVLILIKDQEMSIKDLRERLYNVKKPDFNIYEVVKLI